jgi:hypothetical protein
MVSAEQPGSNNRSTAPQQKGASPCTGRDSAGGKLFGPHDGGPFATVFPTVLLRRDVICPDFDCLGVFTALPSALRRPESSVRGTCVL